MGDYLNYQRNVLNTPHPMYGDLPAGFSVGDLPSSYQSGVSVFNAVTGAQTSGPITVGANAIELAATFSDNHTACDIQLYQSDGVTLITTFKDVNALNCDNLYAGFATLNQILGGGPFIFKLANFSGAGTLTLTCRRTG